MVINTMTLKKKWMNKVLVKQRLYTDMWRINNMEKILYVKKKNVYGNELVYPVCKDAKLFANLTKQKTLSTDDIARIKSLGYVFKHVEEKI